MPTIPIRNSSIVSVPELNQIICLSKEKVHVSIEFTGKVERVDIVFVAGLLLLHRKYGTTFEIKWNQFTRIFEVRHYCKQYQTLYCGENENLPVSFQHISELKDNDNNISESSAPILLINEETLTDIFEKPASVSRSSKIKNLGAKYRVACDAKRTKGERQYAEEKNSVISKLEQKAPIYAFVFSLLYRKLHPFGRDFFYKKYEDRVRIVEKLLNFVEKYVQGLYELAKNIVEHSTGHEGMITIRAYDVEKKNLFDDATDEIARELQTYVFDFGEEGIIPKLIKDTDAKRDLDEIYVEDLNILQHDFGVHDFVRPGYLKVLNQQIRRDIAHYGIMKFYGLLQANDGCFAHLVSRDNSHLPDTDTFPEKKGFEQISEMAIGTCYFFRIPFTPDLTGYTSGNVFRPMATRQGIQALSSVLELEVVDSSQYAAFHDTHQHTPNTIVRFEMPKRIGNRYEERKQLIELNEMLVDSRQEDHKKPDEALGAKYLALDFQRTEQLSVSSLMRILAHLSRHIPQQIIVYNLTHAAYSEFLQDNETYYSVLHDLNDTPYWYENRGVLFFTVGTLRGQLYNFTDLLCGQTEEEFAEMNRIVSLTAPNSYTIACKEKDNNKCILTDIPIYLADFFKQKALLPFDILLLNANDKCLFQTNLELILSKELDMKPASEKNAEKIGGDPFENYYRSMDGYKISNTHFKIGDKTHASDFYYAKRLFQNSYYTARIALMLAMRIKMHSNGPIRGLTLVGYETYSELLLSLTRKFLEELGNREINYFVVLGVEDEGHLKRLPAGASLAENIIIIVPIASTGSTARKIYNDLKDSGSCFLGFYNMLIVCDETYQELNASEEQQSLVTLPIKWDSPEECPLCFDKIQSRPLFETDKSSLTPSLIFDLPRVRKFDINDSSKSFDDVNFDSSLLYKRVKRDGEYILYSTNPDALIEENRNLVEAWCAHLKRKFDGEAPSLQGNDSGVGSKAEDPTVEPTDKVVIIAPCHYANMEFINLLNDNIFGSSATIVYCQIDADYTANFKLLNRNNLGQPGTKVFFVDDSLFTGDTFFKIYDLYREIDPEKNLCGAIFLCNYSTPDIHYRVKAAAGRIYSFVNINVALSPKLANQNPLEHEVRRYQETRAMVRHEVLKNIFRNKVVKLQGFEPTLDNHNDEKIATHVLMFRCTHKIYDFLHSLDSDGKYAYFCEKMTFEEFFQNCFPGEDITVELKVNLMKVLSQYPFLLYMPLRKKVFEWHKAWLEKIMKEVKDLSYLSYEKLREFKSAIRRAVFVSNYMILDGDCLKLLFELFATIEHNGIFEKAKSNLFISKYILDADSAHQESARRFFLFMIQQYVEMMQKNKWCAERLAKNIRETELCLSQKQQSAGGNQFIRMLKIEIGCVLDDFCGLLDKQKWTTDLKKTAGDDDKSRIKNYFVSEKGRELLKSKKFDRCNKVLELYNEKKQLKPSFLAFLQAKWRLEPGMESDKTLARKTQDIFNALKDIFSNAVGAFLIVTDRKSQHHLVYDQDTDKTHFIDELQSERHKMLTDFLEGERWKSCCGDELDKDEGDRVAIRTIAEYEKKGLSQWKDQCKSANTSCITCMEDKKWLLLIRISDPDKTAKSAALGVMGFYSIHVLTSDLLAKQLLMSLRDDLANFILRHHRNDEFNDLQTDELRRRFSLLAGHGQQMMRELSYDDPVFRNVVAMMEHLQLAFITQSSNENPLQNEDNSLRPDKIDVDLLRSIVVMGRKIYETPIVETPVEVQMIPEVIRNDQGNWICPQMDFNLHSNFYFSRNLLRFLCFELYVNAKKNRFHFVGPTEEINRLKTTFSIKDRTFIVEVAGTGPAIGENESAINEIIKHVESGRSLKQDNEVSGLRLVYKVLKALNPENELKMDSKREGNVFMNRITMIIRPRNNEGPNITY